MAIKGNLREASLPDVLQLLALGRKTGCLSVTHRQSFGAVYFDDGRICYASIVNRRDRLGDILVKHGLISSADRERAIQEQEQNPDRRLGEILVANGAIEPDRLRQYITHQIEEAVYHLFTWSQGTFSFDPDVRPDAQDVLVSVSAESLLLEGARRVDEWSLIEKKISSFDLIFATDRARIDGSHVELTPEQDLLLPLIDGQRDVNALVDESGLDEFSVARALFGLASAGFLQEIGRAKTSEHAVAESRVTEHRNLGMAFYKTSMLEEANREFRRVLEMKPDDPAAEFYLGLVALKQERTDEAVRTFRTCAARPGASASVYLNLGYALECTGRLDEARAAFAEAEKRRPDDPVIRLGHAVLALRRGQVSEADVLVQESGKLWGNRQRPPAWFHYRGLIAALRGDLAGAVAVLEEGVRAHPHSAVLLNNLAVTLERRGRYAEAATAAERGSVEEPTMPQLHKNLGDLLYRAARYDDALDAYQRAIRYESNLGGDVYLKLGNIRYRRGERDEAFRCWERSLALAPDNPMARNNLETARRLA